MFALKCSNNKYFFSLFLSPLDAPKLSFTIGCLNMITYLHNIKIIL